MVHSVLAKNDIKLVKSDLQISKSLVILPFFGSSKVDLLPLDKLPLQKQQLFVFPTLHTLELFAGDWACMCF